MLTAFPSDDAAGQRPLLRDLEATAEQALTLGSLAGASDDSARNICVLAFALVLDAYTCCSEIAFAAGSVLEDSSDDTKLYTCEINLPEGRTIDGALKQIVRGCPSALHSRQVPCLLMYTADLDGQLEDLTLRSTLVLAYSRSEHDTDTVRFRLHYDPKVFGGGDAQRVCSQFAHTVDQITAQPPSMLLQDLSKLSPNDTEQLRDWNRAPQPLDFRTTHGRISEWAAKRPREIAVQAWDGDMTRSELDLSSNDLAKHLAQQGCKTGQTVAVLIQKSMWTPVAILAILKTGAAFILLDQDLPPERLKVMTEVVSCTHAVASRENTALAMGFLDNVISLSDKGIPLLVKSIAKQHPSNDSFTAVECNPNDTMFFCFTSGSSGNPKAVEIQHSAWSAGCRPDAILYLADEGARVLHRSSFNFIVSVVELLAPLMNGGTVCIPSAAEHTNDLTNTIRRFRPDCVGLAPSLGKTLNPDNLPPVAIIFAGEPCPASLITQWMKPHMKDVVIAFGSSEGCNHTSMRSIRASNNMTSGNIGKSTSRRFWIVDPRDHNILLPIGATGELLLEGYSIAKGYYKDPAKSADAFIASPRWAMEFGAGLEGRRWYKTGDLVKYTGDGEILHLGRKDFQVKLRGQRIEPAEVENQLLQAVTDEVQNVVVDVAYASNKEQARLTAFLILKTQTQAPDDDSLRTLKRKIVVKLSQKLPSFMVPTHIVVLQKFPQTATGKIDRRQLRGFELGHGEPAPAKSALLLAMNGEHEQTSVLQKAWAEVLGVAEKEITKDSTWTGLGGDSLSAISLAQKVRRSGLSMTVADLLQQSTFADLAQRLQPVAIALNDEHDALPSGKIVPLATTCYQRYSLSMSASPLNALIYHYLIKVRGEVNVAALERAARTVFQRCDSLRMAFTTSACQLKQTALEMESPDIVRRVSTIHCEDADQELEALLARLNASPDHDAWSLPAMWVFLVSPEKVRMLVRFHHAVIDGTSCSLIFEDFQRAIDRPQSLKPRPQFLPYMSKRLLQQDAVSFDYWRRLLQGSSPTMLRRSAIELAANEADISPFFAQRIMVPYMDGRGFATLSTLVKAAWAVVLGGMSTSEDVVFYHLLNGRDEAITGSFDIVGCCITEVPMRVKLTPSSTGRALLQQVQDQVLTSTPHAQLGADTIAKHCSDWAGKINYRHSSIVLHTNVEEVKHLQLGDKAYADVQMNYGSDAVQDFTITSWGLRGGGLQLEFEAPMTLYTAGEVDIVADGLVQAIQLLAVQPDSTLQDIKDQLAFIKI